MTTMTKRATIYLEPALYKVLRVKSAETDCSISELVNQAIRHELAEDQEDLESFEKRAKEPTISYQDLLKKMKVDGKI